MRNTEDTGSISPGSIGGKIKKYRELRGWTQKELGIRCGFTESTADVRIAQYENNKKNPRRDLLKSISQALDIDESALFDADLSESPRMIHALFDLEDFHGLRPVRVNGRILLELGDASPLMGTETQGDDCQDFLEQWYDNRRKNIEYSHGTDKEKENLDNYALWKAGYCKTKTASDRNLNLVKNLIRIYKMQEELEQLKNELNSSNEYSLLDAETKDQLMEEMEGKDFNPEVWEKKLEDIITGGAGSDS